MKKKVLFIAYEMPPRWGPHALRIAYFCKYLKEYGWDITAIGCAPWEGLEDHALSAKLPSDMSVIRIPQTKSGYLSSALWTLQACKIGRALVRTSRPDIILTSAPQYISHMVGFLLSLFTNIPWVADYGDPFSAHAAYRRSKVSQWLAYVLEYLWLLRADRIILVTESTREYYQKNFKWKKATCELVPLGYDQEDQKYYSKENLEDKFVIAFAGSFHLVMSEGPKNFFTAIVRACEQSVHFKEKIRVEIFTRNNAFDILNEVVPAEYINLFHVHRHIPDMTELFSKLSQASCYVIWGFRGGLQIPSKVYVYFGLKKPILCILCNPEDSLKSIIQNYNRGLVVNNTEEEIVSAVLKIFNIHEQGSIHRHFLLNDIKEFQWYYLADILSKILHTVLAEKRTVGC